MPVQITITARHCEIPDDVRQRAQESAEKLARIAHRPQGAEIVFDLENQRHLAEFRMWLPRGQMLIASGEAADFRSALDRAVEKLRSQIDKGTPRADRRQPAS
jgi:ribosomal subunit interface protein